MKATTECTPLNDDIPPVPTKAKAKPKAKAKAKPAAKATTKAAAPSAANRELTPSKIKALLPGLESIEGVKVTYFPSWSLAKKAPATQDFAGRRVIIIRKGAKVVANVFATETGERLNAYFPASKSLKSYSTKHTQVNAIRMALTKA